MGVRISHTHLALVVYLFIFRMGIRIFLNNQDGIGIRVSHSKLALLPSLFLVLLSFNPFFGYRKLMTHF